MREEHFHINNDAENAKLIEELENKEKLTKKSNYLLKEEYDHFNGKSGSRFTFVFEHNENERRTVKEILDEFVIKWTLLKIIKKYYKKRRDFSGSE